MDNDLWAALEKQIGIAKLWELTKEWVQLAEVDWNEDEWTPLSEFLYERAGMDAGD